MSSTGTFMYDELIEFDLNHDKFLGEVPPAPTRDYKITFERDWNDMFKDCRMPYVKDRADTKAIEQDTGKYIYDWADVVNPGTVSHDPLFVLHKDFADLAHARSVHVGNGFEPVINNEGELGPSKLKVFTRSEAYNQWDSGERVSSGSHSFDGDVNALYLTLADVKPDENGASIIPALGQGHLGIYVHKQSASEMMEIKYYRQNDSNNVESIIVEVLKHSNQGYVSIYENWIQTNNFTIGNSLHLYMELHPVPVDDDGNAVEGNGSVRIASFQSSNAYHMSTYAKCFTEEWDTAFRSDWADENCFDDSNVQRTFKETMRLRLDDLFLATKQGDERQYSDDQGNAVAALSLTKIAKFLNPGNTGEDGNSADNEDPFPDSRDFGSRVGTQPQMLSIFDRALNYGRFKDVSTDNNGTPYRQLDLRVGDSFGFTVKFHDKDNTQSDNSITILLLCKQKPSDGGD